MNYYKRVLNYFIIILLLFVVNFGVVNAALLDNSDLKSEGTTQTGHFLQISGFNKSVTASGIVAFVIQAFLSLLGIIFIILIITAGHKWMTAGGSEEKVTEAKDMIRRAIIGLIIIVAAYAITHFVFTHLDFAGTTGSRPGVTDSSGF